MIPLFKTSNGSIGKSILILDDPKDLSPEEADSVFALAKLADLKRIVFVEDTMGALPETDKMCKKLGFDYVYGLRISVRNSESKEDASSDHKIVIFAKNGKAASYLNQIYTEAFAESDGFLTYAKLKNIWHEDLVLAVPFYDSFLFKNTLNFCSIVPDLSFTKPVFFIEKNGLPFDNLIEEKVLSFCKDGGFETELVKSIYYAKKKDAVAFLTYKMICSEKFSKEKSLSNPGMEHFCSDEFCFESYLNYVNIH